ncbi:hypothetical protein E4U41_006806 [Claviceps citrina]|nr:hypothetical protein E4U41_006806 [Claviceps citrina]
MPFEPRAIPPSTPPYFRDAAPEHQHDAWVPLLSHGCTFGPEAFSRIMMNMIHNPNLNSTWLYRADILYDDAAEPRDGDGLDTHPDGRLADDEKPLRRDICGMARRRTLVRRLVPRSEKRDRPLNQTCAYHEAHEAAAATAAAAGAEDAAAAEDAAPSAVTTTLVTYLPHASSLQDLPFYHPKVRGIGHLHRWDPRSGTGTISVHFLHGAAEQDALLKDAKLSRVAYHLLEVLHRHGQGSTQGYVKRVRHDLVLPQARVQDRYAQLKAKHARHLVDTWAEVTDPGKHVFEDLGIAAFLMELWADMYRDGPFPGFVDIGCGNGLLVYILRQEGYQGWGFDARARKSWPTYTTPSGSSPTGRSLEERLLVPAVAATPTPTPLQLLLPPSQVHDGSFPPGTFIISNHADELTPWTPLLGALSRCPFLMIPCCSHNLRGDRFRARPPRDKTKPASTYASLVDWVSCLAEDCGWAVETEMLRIPSTRNTGILGRTRRRSVSEADVARVVARHGGLDGYAANVVKLVKGGPRAH